MDDVDIRLQLTLHAARKRRPEIVDTVILTAPSLHKMIFVAGVYSWCIAAFHTSSRILNSFISHGVSEIVDI